MEAMTTRKLFDLNTSLFGDHVVKDYFEERELTEVVINFEPNQHTDFRHDIGGKIVVHSPHHVGSVKDLSYSILPGYRYEVFLSKRLEKRLPPPYKSNCFEYKRKNGKEFINKVGSFPSVELDRTGCFRNCLLRHILDRCKCWPLEMPYFTGDPMFPNAGKFKICSWDVLDDELNDNAVKDYERCYKAFYSSCQSKCPSSCLTEDFTIKMTQSVWPSQESIRQARCKQKKAHLNWLRLTHSKISVKYEALNHERLVMYPSLSLAQLEANLGGILSALIGVSVVTIYRYITRKIFKCRVVGDIGASGAETNLSAQVEDD